MSKVTYKYVNVICKLCFFLHFQAYKPVRKDINRLSKKVLSMINKFGCLVNRSMFFVLSILNKVAWCG